MSTSDSHPDTVQPGSTAPAKVHPGWVRFPEPEPVQVPAAPMSLRDYFAGQALAGLLAGPGGFKDTHEEGLSALYAGAAYEMADAMLEARAKVGSKG